MPKRAIFERSRRELSLDDTSGNSGFRKKNVGPTKFHKAPFLKYLRRRDEPTINIRSTQESVAALLAVGCRPWSPAMNSQCPREDPFFF